MSPARMERVEAGIRVVLAFNEALNRHDVPGMMALMSDDCLLDSAARGPTPRASGTAGGGRWRSS